MNERADGSRRDRPGNTGPQGQRELPVDASAGEPLEPTLEDIRSPDVDSGEPDHALDGTATGAFADDREQSPLTLRDPDREPERDETAAQADPPTGNLIPPETPDRR